MYEDKILKSCEKKSDETYICVIKIDDFEEQCRCFKKLLKIKNVNLIIVDTLGFFYRLELKKDAHYANKKMDKQLQVLSELSRDSDVLITNQIYQNIDDNKVEVVGGNMIKNWSKSIIKLEKSPRKMIFEKPESKELNFKIDCSGIVVL